jgi:hypothetical protein
MADSNITPIGVIGGLPLFPNLTAEVVTPKIAQDPEWITDPAQLSFEDFKERLIWGKPQSDRSRPCLNRKFAASPFEYRVSERDNYYPNGEDPKYGDWDKALESGRSYLVGESTPMNQFLKNHTSALNWWQQMAYAWCIANPSKKLVLVSKKFEWSIYKRGGYVEFGLPHQDKGGEKHWISQNGKTRVLVNVD